MADRKFLKTKSVSYWETKGSFWNGLEGNAMMESLFESDWNPVFCFFAIRMLLISIQSATVYPEAMRSTIRSKEKEV